MRADARRCAVAMPKREPAAARQKSAQAVERLELGIFRNEAPRRRRQADIGERADHQHPGPHIDVDAEFEAAHPAREQHLPGEREQRAADAHQKNFSGDELRQPAVAAVGEDGLDARDDARRRRRRRGGDVFGTDQRHGFSPRRRRPGCERRQGHRVCISKEPLRIGWAGPIVPINQGISSLRYVGQNAFDRLCVPRRSAPPAAAPDRRPRSPGSASRP